MAFIAVAALALIIFVLRPGQHTNEPSAAAGGTTEGHMQQSREQLRTARRDLLKEGQKPEPGSPQLAGESSGGVTGARSDPDSLPPALDRTTSLPFGKALPAPDTDFGSLDRQVPPEGGTRAVLAPQPTPMPTFSNPGGWLPVDIPAVSMELVNPKQELINGKGEVFMFANAALRKAVALPYPAVQISLWARGDEAKGEWPDVQISVGGSLVGELVVDSKDEQEYDIPVSIDPTPSAVLEVRFVNDFYDRATKEDRNVYIRRIAIMMAAQ